MSDIGVMCGVSHEASVVDMALKERRDDLNRSHSIGNQQVLDELNDIGRECRYPDWDGCGAEPVAWDTYLIARSLIHVLPPGTPTPSVGAEPDGHLTLEWHRTPRRTLSVSISPEGELHYAALLGPNCAYGTEVFLEDLPERIRNMVAQVYR